MKMGENFHSSDEIDFTKFSKPEILVICEILDYVNIASDQIVWNELWFDFKDNTPSISGKSVTKKILKKLRGMSSNQRYAFLESLGYLNR